VNGLPVSELAMMMAALIGAGAIAGLIGGLFGVGGGTVLVPALFYAFSVLGVGGESNLHVAIGTSLLTIVATSLRSLSTHRKHGAVDEVVLKTWTPWVAFGALVGAFIAHVGAIDRLWCLSGRDCGPDGLVARDLCSAPRFADRLGASPDSFGYRYPQRHDGHWWR